MHFRLFRFLQFDRLPRFFWLINQLKKKSNTIEVTLKIIETDWLDRLDWIDKSDL